MDLPHPDSPTTPRVSPFRTSSETPSTACTKPLCSPRRERERTGKCLTTSTVWRSTGAVMRFRAALRRRRARPLGAPPAWRGRGDRRPFAPATHARGAPELSDSASKRCGQRGSKRQPSGGASSDGGAPGIAARRRTRGRSGRGIDPRRPHVYGCCGSRKSCVFGASSTTRPAYITTTRSASSATTPMSCVIRTIDEPWSRWSRFMSSRICAWMVTSSAVVGSSAIRSDGLQESAIAIITRWRIPPEN